MPPTAARHGSVVHYRRVAGESSSFSVAPLDDTRRRRYHSGCIRWTTAGETFQAGQPDPNDRRTLPGISVRERRLVADRGRSRQAEGGSAGGSSATAPASGASSPIDGIIVESGISRDHKLDGISNCQSPETPPTMVNSQPTNKRTNIHTD
jgi:hypothetical protein